MTWETPVPIFDDEDEDELIARFVDLSARYPTFPPFEVAKVVFQNLRDPMRANQAAMIWGSDLEILERIKQARLNGPDDNVITTKEQLEKRLLATIEDTTIGAQEKKVRIEGYKALAQVKGWDNGDGDGAGKRFIPQFVFGIDPRSQNVAQ